MERNVTPLSNPPLLETAFSVIVKSPPLTMDAIGGFVDGNAPGFTMTREIVHQTISVALGAFTSHPKEPMPIGRKYMKDKNLVLMIQNKSPETVEFVFSVLPPYTRWEDLYEKAKPLLRAFLDTFRISSVNRIAVRSIDRLFAPYEGCPVTDIIKNVPPDTAGLQTPIVSGFRYQDTMYHPQFDLCATVIRSTQKLLNDPRFAVILDSDVFTRSDRTYSVVDIEPQLEKIVRLKDIIFFQSVGDKCMEGLK